MARKEYRELTVSEATNYGRKTAPMLRIQGHWFQELGFNIGDPVLVQCEDGKIIITRNEELQKARDEEKLQLAAERERMEREFAAKRQQLRQLRVAERKARYEA